MTVTAQAAGSRRAQRAAGQRRAGPGSAARCARSSPRSGRSGPPTGRSLAMIVITIGISALLSWGRIQDYASQPARRAGATRPLPDQVTGDRVQHVRADPRPAGHRGAGRAHDHLRVLHRHDQDLADRDAAPGNRVRGQGGRVHRGRARRRAGRRRSAPTSSARRSSPPSTSTPASASPGCCGRSSAAGCSWPCAGCSPTASARCCGTPPGRSRPRSRCCSCCSC